MPHAASVVTSQRDFSAGEIDVAAKRDDDNPIVKASARQMANWRILDTKGVTNRPGRRALFQSQVGAGRTDEITMSPGNTFKLVFGFVAGSSGVVQVWDANGTRVANFGGYAWTNATAGSVGWTQIGLSIYITFAGQIPIVLTWDGVSAWSVANFAELVTGGGQKRTFFYRIAPKGITMGAGGTTGPVNITFSKPFLKAGHAGTRLRFCGRQMVVNSVTTPQLGNATVIEPLPPGQNLNTTTDPAAFFAVGDIVRGTVSNAQAIITAINSGTLTITVQLLSTVTTISSAAFGDAAAHVSAQSSVGFVATDVLVGAGGAAALSGPAVNVGPQAVTFWDEEVMNSLQGWPGSCFSDQGRLGFCNFPTVPNAIGWSAFGSPTDLYVEAFATAAMFELAPNRVQVLYVAAGAESNEFVFCKEGIYYIPISVTNPLKPGSVAFNLITADGAAQVQPRLVDEVMLYVAAGSQDVMALTATGSYTRFYRTLDLTHLHTHLLSSPVAIAVPTTGGTFPERYVYVLNSNGSVIVGKYSPELKDLKAGVVGWLPWSGGGTVSWIAALNADVIFTTSYAPNSIAPASIVEVLDDTRYLDASQLYNTQPAGLPVPGGKGPLWWMPNGSVDVMDGTRMMGTYIIDTNGFLVAQHNGGEDLTSATLVVGQAWTATLEPFIPAAQAGQDMEQRLWPRRLRRVQAYVINSSGFVMARLYSDQSGVNLPATGTIMKKRRITTWNQDEDPTKPPTLREQSYLDRPIGRSHDPRWCLIKDTPGPIQVAEISTEVSV